MISISHCHPLVVSNREAAEDLHKSYKGLSFGKILKKLNLLIKKMKKECPYGRSFLLAVNKLQLKDHYYLINILSYMEFV
ncbi:hypothetical protein SAMN04487975_1122 [Planococcus glaciei]|nr:hypothetical protein SAMN04487975_1122 [Planococcus glaciei]